MKYIYVTDYKDNDKLRKSFNELTEKVYGFNFIQWYDNDLWGEKYIPYSLADGDTIVANVSINLMDFHIDGIEKRYIQIGTVMTDEGYRNQGLSRYLMEKAIDEYKDKVDGIYLFANDSAIDFYPKFGFVKGKEYEYSKEINPINSIKRIEKVDMSDKANWRKLFYALEHRIKNDRFNMDNFGLFAFWTTGWMSNSVYYLKEEDTYVIADVNEEKLCIYDIVAEHHVDLETVILSFGNEVRKVKLGFTPKESDGYVVEELCKEDCTLFILGEDLEEIEKKKLMFPILSHA